MRIHKRDNYNSSPAFTIVELLIVIVVIAILAAITIVAYNGIQDRARASAASSALSNAVKKIKYWQAEQDTTLAPASLALAGVSDTESTKYQYNFGQPAAADYCITVTISGVKSYKTSTSNTDVVLGGCAGHGQGGVAAITNFSTSPHATAGWNSQTPSASTRTYVSNGANDGGSTYQVTTGAAEILRISIPQAVGNVNVGDVIGISFDINAPAAITGQMEVGVNGTFPKSSVFSISTGWNRIYGEVTIPPGSAGNLTLVQFVSIPTVSSGQVWKATRALITKGAHTSAYADGNTGDWIWNGTPPGSVTSTGPPQ